MGTDKMHIVDTAKNSSLYSNEPQVNTISSVHTVQSPIESEHDVPDHPEPSASQIPATRGHAATAFIISVIVVHYKDSDHLLTCLKALWADRDISEIIVVDNASGSEATEIFAMLPPGITIIRCNTNLGFGGGANLGARYARGEQLVFLNPDTIPDPGCIGILGRHLAEHGGVAGPLVRTGEENMVAHGWTVDRMLLPRCLEDSGEPLFVQGCCLATTRVCFEAVGGFDDRYFLFQEDVEFCWQALRRGYAVDIVDKARLFHEGGAAAAGGYRRDGLIETTSDRILLRERNGWAVIVACAPRQYIIKLFILSAIRTALFAGLFLRYRRPIDALRLIGGIVWNISHCSQTLERRWRPMATEVGDLRAWNRIARQWFIWDLIRKGERLRFVDRNNVKHICKIRATVHRGRNLWHRLSHLLEVFRMF